MDIQEYTDYKNALFTEATISVGDLPDRGFRPLVEGYTLDREDFLVYHDPDDGLIRRYVGSTERAFATWDALLLAPSKRAYPEKTDQGFAYLMRQRGAELPFTRHPDE